MNELRKERERCKKVSNFNSPRIKSEDELRNYMFDVEIALTPALLFGVYRFGFAALKVIILAVAASVLTEVIFQKCMKKPVTISNGSAVVTGLLMACVLSPAVPVYVPVIGSIFATLVVVDMYGGYGRHFISPALAARGFLLISFTSVMTNYKLDGMAGATPLQTLMDGGAVMVKDLAIGNIMGAIGEVSAVAILIGFLYLVVRRAASVITPVVCAVAFALFIGLFSGQGFDVNYILAQIFGGGFMFAICFFATDYVTTPASAVGKVIYGVCLGLITGLFRVLGTSTESVSYAVLFCTLLVPLIDKLSTPKEVKEAA